MRKICLVWFHKSEFVARAQFLYNFPVTEIIDGVTQCHSKTAEPNERTFFL